MTLHASANLVEACVWLVLGLACAVNAARAEAHERLIFAGLALNFVLFAVSDVIESRTGAWWRPAWLLALKACCVCGFALGFGAYYRALRAGNSGKTGD